MVGYKLDKSFKILRPNMRINYLLRRAFFAVSYEKHLRLKSNKSSVEGVFSGAGRV